MLKIHRSYFYFLILTIIGSYLALIVIFKAYDTAFSAEFASLSVAN